jgi:hypothetical protein
MQLIAAGIFTAVHLYGRDGLRLRPTVAWQRLNFGGHVRTVRRIIWLRYREKNGTAWRCPPKPWRRWKPSLPKLNEGPSASFDQFLTRLLLAMEERM